MRYWYGFTGEDFIIGHGRAIRQVVPPSHAWQGLLEAALQHYAHYAASSVRHVQAIPAGTFIAALVAPLAAQKFGADSPAATPFSSAGQVLRIFDGLNVEQAAVNLFNGRVASAYAESGDDDAIAARVTEGFNAGALLFLPRDVARLHTPEVLNMLPGALVALLSRAQAERKSFADYLRRGTPPTVSDHDKTRG